MHWQTDSNATETPGKAIEGTLEFVKPLTVQKGETEALDMKGGATDNTNFPGQSEANLIIISKTVRDKTTTGAMDKFGNY